MADTSQQLLEAMEAFDDVADIVTPHGPLDELDETSLQIFWRDWPRISSWAGSLWRRLNQEFVEAAGPSGSGEFDTGGGD